MTISRDKLGAAVDALMDAIGADARVRSALGEMLTIIFHNITSTLGATLTPISRRLESIESRVDNNSKLMHEVHERLDRWADIIDQQAFRLDRKRAELNVVEADIAQMKADIAALKARECGSRER